MSDVSRSEDKTAYDLSLIRYVWAPSDAQSSAPTPNGWQPETVATTAFGRKVNERRRFGEGCRAFRKSLVAFSSDLVPSAMRLQY